jgi:2-keto-4-pentenoate hydratase/2-oxohepta-3-ene-1,7-dioic acid hydratase in catechol pathway
MRLCRVLVDNQPAAALYNESAIVPLAALSEARARATGRQGDRLETDSLLEYLPPDGASFTVARDLCEWYAKNPGLVPAAATIAVDEARVLVPVPRPNKIFLLAGNYADHIREGGGTAAERAETFPYVFMKPPTTTLTPPGQAVRIPRISPGAIDWELELAVVIGRRAKGLSESEALSCVAGYTIINDISNRRFRPNPDRKERPKDAFFDWLHGKWHDGFCPCGPCITSADEIPDPQRLALSLKVNTQEKQRASTSQMVFPVAALVEFISSFVTLEPGDLISTGTPAGVGSATGTFLKPGDVMHGSIESIGTLVTPVASE